MNRDDIALLYRYDRWAWDRVLAKAAQVPAELYVALAPVPHGSLRGTLVHALSAEGIWLRRWHGESPSKHLMEIDIPTCGDVEQRWKLQRQALEEYLATLTDDSLNATFDYKTTRGTAMSDVLWHTLAHVVNHNTQHRSEAAMLLTSFGFSPGDLDLIMFLRQKNLEPLTTRPG